MAARTAPTKTGGREATTGVIPGDFALSVGMPDTKAPRGWKWTPLTAVARLETGHTPSRNHPEYWDGDIPWIGIKDATGNHGLTIDDTLQHTTQAGIDNSSARVLPAHTVCLSRTASVGYVVVMGRPMATSQDFVNWVCSDALDYRYLKYALLSERRSFLRFASGTTHQTIYFPEVKAFHVCLPPLPEQRAIAGVLGALDDKIEVNRKTARVLEGIARAVFTSWFVDFDPVRRHPHAPHAAASHPGSAAARRAPGPAPLPTDLAALFPTRLVDSPMGQVPEIPEGWRVGRLDETIVLQRGFDLPKEQRRPGSVPVIAASGLNGSHDTAMVKGPGVTTGRSGVLGNVFLVQEDFWPLNTSLYVKEYTDSNPYHAYFVLQRIDFKMFNAGSAVPTLNRNHVHNLATVIPPKAVTTAFEQIVAPMFHRMRSLERQSTTLAALREALLPKLISGDLRIADAEKIVGRAV